YQVVAPADLHLVDMRPQGAAQVYTAHPGAAPAIAPPANLESALLALFEQNVPNLYEHIEETVFRAAYRYCHGNQLQTGR
ncbi:AAA family ATPase, partial [Pseudomonas sp. SIMBA_064]